MDIARPGGVDMSKGGSVRTVDFTPAYPGGQTPMYGLRDGSKTPLLGQTPIHGVSQTPMYDGKSFLLLIKFITCFNHIFTSYS